MIDKMTLLGDKSGKLTFLEYNTQHSQEALRMLMTQVG